MAYTNWRVSGVRHGTVIAVEPSREYEHVFTGGPDPFWAAVEYAASELRKGLNQ